MFNFINYIGQNLQLIVENGGYFLLFIVTILEGIPIIGQFVPGHTVVIIAGFLSKLEVLNISIVTLVVILGAITGDFIGFSLGKKYGLHFITKFGSYVFIKKEYITKAQNLISENPVKTIILGRFSPITRPLSPFIVGASGLHVKKFWFIDFIAAVAWSLIAISIGYIFGASYHVVAAVFGKFVFFAIILAILMIWGYRFINKNFHIFAKYELITLGLNLLGLFIFFKTLQDAITDKVFLLELDLYVYKFFQANTHEPLISIMNAITNIFSPSVITLAGFIALIYFIYKKRLYFVSIITLALGGGYLFTFLIKNIVMRIRPEYALITQSGYSFPSGHSVAVTIFFTLVVYFFIIKIQSILLRETLIVISVTIVLATAFSRIYLGVHWLSDVLGGIGLGLFWVTLTILVLKYLNMLTHIFKNKSK